MLNLDSYSVEDLLLKRRSLHRQLSAVEGLRELRVAVLGGSSTNELVNLLELHLLSSGFRPVFYTSEYGRFYEEAVHDVQALFDFKPEIIYLHTSYRNVENLPPLSCTEEDLPSYISAELKRYRAIWDSLERIANCQIIQNNFEMPPHALLGNMDAAASAGASRFYMLLNMAFAQEAAQRPRLFLQDVHGLSARIGLRHWFDWNRYWSYKLLLMPDANLELTRSLTSIIKAMFGRSSKVLVLDLDNTLWGGVIGDDGVDRIQIGRETAVAEAYTAFQEYCLSLRNRGILLAICSKNEDEIAKSGLNHPSSILKLEHFSCFKANWRPKHENIREIAEELSLGIDSFVFVDDNPAEREIVRSQVPAVAVPDVGSDVTRYAEIIERGRYFEPAALLREDLQRAELYASNSRRQTEQSRFATYGEYLDSLEMTAEIDRFKPVYLERIAQLTNKTNQFNLTTRRYTPSEISTVADDANHIGIYGKLGDRFGDNGLVSVVLGSVKASELHIDLWLTSCRVLKRDMETAMLDVLVARAKEKQLDSIVGYYFPTVKNGMVADHYEKLGFIPKSTYEIPGSSVWSLVIKDYQPRNRHIRILEPING